DLLGVDRVRQREGPRERPVGPLDPMIALLLDLGLELALAPEGQDIVFHPDVDVLRVDARQLRLEDDGAVLLVDVHRGRPAAAHPGLFARAAVRPAERLVEQPVHPLLQADQVAERFPTHDRHDYLLLACLLLQFLTVYSASTTSSFGPASDAARSPEGGAD